MEASKWLGITHLVGHTQAAAVISAHKLFEMLASTLNMLTCMNDQHPADFPEQPGIILGFLLN